MKINNFWGDLSDTLAKKEALRNRPGLERSDFVFSFKYNVLGIFDPIDILFYNKTTYLLGRAHRCIG